MDLGVKLLTTLILVASTGQALISLVYEFEVGHPALIKATLPISSDVGLTTPMWSDVT